jgi:uncharacterized membrane protein
MTDRARDGSSGSVFFRTRVPHHRAEPQPPRGRPGARRRPLWYDIVQTLTLTISGIANAVLSLAILQTVLIVLFIDPARPTVPASSWAFAVVVIVLGAVGVYLGRYLRFNSWDVRHPLGMLRKLGAHFRVRGRRSRRSLSSSRTRC